MTTPLPTGKGRLTGGAPDGQWVVYSRVRRRSRVDDKRDESVASRGAYRNIDLNRETPVPKRLVRLDDPQIHDPVKFIRSHLLAWVHPVNPAASAAPAHLGEKLRAIGMGRPPPQHPGDCCGWRQGSPRGTSPLRAQMPVRRRIHQ